MASIEYQRASDYDQGSSPIWIKLLGSFALFRNGELALLAAGTKTELLLSVLAIHNKDGVARDTLIALLWPDQDAALASQSLNTLMSHLRRQLGASLQGANPVSYDGALYQLNYNVGIGLDIASFDLLVQQGNRELHRGDRRKAIALYEQAITFYHGDLRQGPDIFAVIERERLRTAYLNVLAHIANDYFEKQEYGLCLDYAQRLIAKDACREDAHRLMMRCYTRIGQRSQALRHYQLCESVLHAELGITPESATTALCEQIRQSPESI